MAAENTEIARLGRELREAQEREAAAAEVLRVLSSSPGDLDAVFRAMLENATRLCEAKFGTLFRYDGGKMHRSAGVGTPASLIEFQRKRGPFVPDAGTTMFESIRTKQALMSNDEAASPTPGVAAKYGGARSTLYVPLLKYDQVVGIFVIYRQEVRPFTGKQIELVQNFAAQAVIAIENTRLLNELRQRTDDLTESLEQQTATSEVLKVISSSPGELQPVFDAILKNATRICEAKFANLLLYQHGAFQRVALYGAPSAWVEDTTQQPSFQPGTKNPIGRMIQTKGIVSVPDMMAEPGYSARNPVVVALVEKAGVRTIVAVPMLKDGELVGAIAVYRQEVRPFSDKQIELVQNFAAQAVVAIENTRLLGELRESLQQQTATADVLKIISRSTFDLAAVLDTLVNSAAQLCEADSASINRQVGEHLRQVAHCGQSPELIQFMESHPIPAGRGSIVGRTVQEGRIIHIADVLSDPEFTFGEAAKIGGVRTMLGVPLLREGTPIGVIVLQRNSVKPFTSKQIELLATFADQAVIAIENVRLFDEVQARTDELSVSLEQQTATSEVLRVISSSPGDLDPVFQTMLESARRICGAEIGLLLRYDDGAFTVAAETGLPTAFAEWWKSRPIFRPSSDTLLGRVAATRQADQLADLAATPAYREGNPMVVAGVELGGMRSLLTVPIVKENELIGAIGIYRQEVRPFTDKQIELVQNFAAQAVIAIENTRLLGELRESLQQQTATADVLKVISRSTFDLHAVLDTLTASAAQLCRAERSAIRLLKDGLYHNVASYGFLPEHKQRMEREPVRPGPGSMVGRVAVEQKSVHLIDAQLDLDAEVANRSRSGNTHTMLGVPLLREGAPIGVLLLQRSVVQPFTDQEIALVESFADQAVIAIENVRLFDEIQHKSRQLAEASQHKSQFLANMSHELRTPLNAILGYTELIADGIYGAPPEKMGAVLKRVESNGKHLLGLINAVLDLSKIEAGQFTLDLADYSLQNIAQTVYNAVESLAVDKKLVFKTEVQSGLPPGHGDERRLTQVLLNLVGNAIKFTDAGGVIITAGASDGTFNLAIRDTGPGISAADQAKLFQEFQQADNSRTRKKEGTGLGLAISKRIIEMHGGKIWIESQVGQGSTFFVMLPVQAQARSAVPSN